MLKYTIIFWILTLLGCATGYQSDQLDYSLVDIQKIVSESMPEEVAEVSSNGREFYSKPFTQKMEKAKPLVLMSKVTILGDRRPYNISVEINTLNTNKGDASEKFQNGDPYQGEDSLSKRIVSSIQQGLAKRRKQKNLFDDFRPF